MKKENNEIDVKLRELNINHYSSIDTQLANLQTFIEEFGDYEQYKFHKRDIDYLTADALCNSKRHEEALILFQNLYQFESDPLRPLYTQRIVEQLIMLEREDEALKLVADSLETETNLIYNLDMLFWAVTNIENADAKLGQYFSYVKAIALFIGLEVPAEYITFSEGITYLKLERTEAGRRYNKLMMKIHGLTPLEQTKALQAYIEQEIVTEYRDLAKGSLQELK